METREVTVGDRLMKLNGALTPDEGGDEEEFLCLGLSEREDIVLRCAMQGLTDKEICISVGVAQTTIRTYWTRIRSKLGAVNRAQAIAEAMRRSNYSGTAREDGILSEMLETSGLLSFAIDPVSDRVFLSTGAAALLGLDKLGSDMTESGLVRRVLVSERRLVAAAFHGARREPSRIAISFRISVRRAAPRWIGMFGCSTVGVNGQIDSIHGVLTDLSPLIAYAEAVQNGEAITRRAV